MASKPQTIHWFEIADFPYDEFEMHGVTVLLFSGNFKSREDPSGVLFGFLVEGTAKDPRFEAGFWNEQACAWECRECEPTHYAMISGPAGV